MPRTTIDIDAPILRDLKRRQKQEAGVHANPKMEALSAVN